MSKDRKILDDYFESDDLYWDVDIDEYINLRREEHLSDWEQMMDAFENGD